MGSVSGLILIAAEAPKVLLEEATSRLMTITKDVKLQIEFNPIVVGEYCLIGYAFRKFRKENFSNDKVDAVEVGSGHSVTAIYENRPTNSAGNRIDKLSYPREKEFTQVVPESGYFVIKIRYKLPDETWRKWIERPEQVDQSLAQIDAASDYIRFASAVAAFGQLLRGGRYTCEFNFDDVIELA